MASPSWPLPSQPPARPTAPLPQPRGSLCFAPSVAPVAVLLVAAPVVTCLSRVTIVPPPEPRAPRPWGARSPFVATECLLGVEAHTLRRPPRSGASTRVSACDGGDGHPREASKEVHGRDEGDRGSRGTRTASHLRSGACDGGDGHARQTRNRSHDRDEGKSAEPGCMVGAIDRCLTWGGGPKSTRRSRSRRNNVSRTSGGMSGARVSQEAHASRGRRVGHWRCERNGGSGRSEDDGGGAPANGGRVQRRRHLQPGRGSPKA